MKIHNGEYSTESHLTDTIRIFAYGNTGAGKSTLLGTLINTFFENTEGVPIIDIKSNDSTKKILEWIENLRNNKFPETTIPGSILDLKLGIVSSKRNFKLKFVIYEISGEDLRNMDARIERKFEEEYHEALLHSDVMLSIVPIDELVPNNLFIGQFYNYLFNYKIQVPMALVLTKWDLVNIPERYNNKHNADELYLENIFRNNLKWPKAFLELSNFFKNPEIFFFSIGEVENGYNENSGQKISNTIKKYNPTGIKEIAEWIVKNSIHKRL